MLLNLLHGIILGSRYLNEPSSLFRLLSHILFANQRFDRLGWHPSNVAQILSECLMELMKP